MLYWKFPQQTLTPIVMVIYYPDLVILEMYEVVVVELRIGLVESNKGQQGDCLAKVMSWLEKECDDD